jgi:hypothetical protein
MMSPQKEEKVSRTALVFLSAYALVSTIVGRAFTALTPSPADGQLFAYMGQEWLRGRLPYVDIWDFKPPGILALIALAFSHFPNTFKTLAFVEGIFIIGTIVTVYLIMRRCGAPFLAAVLATLAAAIACNLKAFNEHGTYTEIYLLWPATLSMYFFVRAGPRFQGKFIFLAGLFTGFATLFKQVGFSPLLAQGAFLAFVAVRRQLSPAAVFRSVLTNLAGVFAAWAPFAGYFASHHALGAMVDACLVAPVMYRAGGGHSILFRLDILASKLQPLASLIIAAGVGITLYFADIAKRSLNPPDAEEKTPDLQFFWPLAFLWLFGDLCGSLAGGRGFAHYFLALVPSLSVVVGFTYWELVPRIPRYPNEIRLKMVMLVFIVGPLFFPQSLDVRDFLNLTVKHEAPPVRSWEKIAESINETRAASDTLFAWDYLPGIYFATGMRSPTKQLFGFRIFQSPTFHQKFGEEIIQELDAEPPTFIVDATADSEIPAFRQRDSVYNRFRRLVDGGYLLVYRAEELKLYKRAGS